MFRLKPREDKFFVLFSKNSRLVEEVTRCLCSALDDTENLAAILERASSFEQQADVLHDEIVDELKKTFITPLDREDLYALANMLDDLADRVQGIVERMYVYRADQPSPVAMKLAVLIEKTAGSLVHIFDMLSNVQGNQKELLAEVRTIVERENEGDRLYREGMAQLFSECDNPVEIIKWKEILEHMEDSLDHCEKIGDVIRGVVMKYA